MLPSEWIDRLFARFGAMYGAQWAEKWRGFDIEEVKATWAEDLDGVTGEQLRKALDHVKANCAFPPSLPEFLGVCRQFRPKPQNVAYLPAPRGELPDNAVMRKVKDASIGEPRRSGREWARKILANPTAYPWISKQFAEEALGIVQ
jgi:hypothetical protein